MREPNLLSQQRHFLRVFRKSAEQRARAQTISEEQYNHERQVIDEAHAGARAAADAARATAETDAQTLHQAEQKNADAELKQVRQTIYRYMGEVSKVEEQARSALEGGGWLSLVEDIRAANPSIDTSRHAGQELAGVAHDATQAVKSMLGLVEALVTDAQLRARRRQDNLGIAILVAKILVAVTGLLLVWSSSHTVVSQPSQATSRVVCPDNGMVAKTQIGGYDNEIQGPLDISIPGSASMSVLAPLGMGVKFVGETGQKVNLNISGSNLAKLTDGAGNRIICEGCWIAGIDKRLSLNIELPCDGPYYLYVAGGQGDGLIEVKIAEW